MSTFYGADVEQLRSLAAKLDHAAESLRSTRGRIGSAIRSSPWHGPSANRFRSDWETVNARRLESAARTLRDSAQALRRNADQQASASSAGGGSIGFVAGGPASTPGLRFNSTGAHVPGISGIDVFGIVGAATRDVLHGINGGLDGKYPGAPDWFPFSIGDVIGKVPGIGGLVDAIGTADNAIGIIGDPERSIGEKFLDLTQFATGKIPGPVGYWAGAAVAQLRDVGELAAKGDWSAATFGSNFDWVAKHPGEAALGVLQDTVGYLPQVARNLGFGAYADAAEAQWRDVGDLAARADFRPETVKNTAGYIAKDPGGAAVAAAEAVVGYLPKLHKNLESLVTAVPFKLLKFG